MLAIERLGVFLLVASPDPLPTERRTLPVRVPRPTPADQRTLWDRGLRELVPDAGDAVGALVHQFDFGPAEIARSVAAAAAAARLAKGNGHAGTATPLTLPTLWRACREQTGWRLDELAQRITPAAAWDDIVLPPDVLQQLRELAAQVAHRPHVYEGWGFDALLSRGRGITALFSGSSGTGKTMAAEVLAHDLSLDLFRVDLSGVVSKYIGETEKNLRRLFDASEQSGAILFFDEADALFGRRSEVKDSHDRYANIEVNYLLQRMESYRGLAILATNMKSMLDQAFLRRLRFLVDFPFPDSPLRQQIWRRAFPPRAALEGIDFAALSRLEVPGGNIKNIALNAAFLAAADRRPITMAHVVRAARREYAKIDKLPTDAEFGRLAPVRG
jgi:ATP-dependent 26S proteasome regulatory subunit